MVVLTQDDWLEIFYALEAWAGHIENIISVIGPYGENAAEQGVEPCGETQRPRIITSSMVGDEALTQYVKREFSRTASIHLFSSPSKQRAASTAKKDGFQVIGYYRASTGLFRAIID